jgi:catalase
MEKRKICPLVVMLLVAFAVHAKHEATAVSEGKGQGGDSLLDKAKNALGRRSENTNAKINALEEFVSSVEDGVLTTDVGVHVSNTDDSLVAGERGPTIMDDFHFREKIMRFDHERIPERVVHARGAGAHGYFQVYKSLSHLTSAHFLNHPSEKTPVFVRFSTVQGGRGSADTVRDVRGFATKFYTQDGNFDLVGNNMPVFFIQDGIKFPDLVHAVKPEPHHDIPTGASAHDAFYDFVGLTPESAHMMMWLMSDRAIPQKFATMEGFGVHTFRLVNSHGKSHFVKFHWKPLMGVHSLVWDEAVKICGEDADFHRRDLWESIEQGLYPEYELGIQVLDEKEADKFMSQHGMDILDCTKIWPEEIIPVQKIGKMILNKNTDNFFAETEQAAFCISNIVPGIDFSDDPMLQARIFSYFDTQLTRLGGPNFNEIPINRPLVPVHNNQQDGFMRQRINVGANYIPNRRSKDSPARDTKHGFVHYPAPVSGHKIRKRPELFREYWNQAAMFYWSMASWEQDHIVNAFCFELGRVSCPKIRQRFITNILCNSEAVLAQRVSLCLGLEPMTNCTSRYDVTRSPALSQQNTTPFLKGRRVAILAAPGFDESGTQDILDKFAKAYILGEVISITSGKINGSSIFALGSLMTVGSVVYDAIYIPGGRLNIASLMSHGHAASFIREAFRHGKPIAGTKEGAEFVKQVITSDLQSLYFQSPADPTIAVEVEDASASGESAFHQMLDKLHLHRTGHTGDAGDAKSGGDGAAKYASPLSKEQGVLLSYDDVDKTFIAEFIALLTKARFWARHVLVPARA